MPTAIFDTMRAQGHRHASHHPYDAFTPVVDLVEQAAPGSPGHRDQATTLYRTSGASPRPCGRSWKRRATLQARHGPGRAQGAGLTEANNIQSGEAAGGGGGPRRLRARRTQDPLQEAVPRRPPRGPNDEALRPPCDRQLQSADRAALLGSELTLPRGAEKSPAKSAIFFNTLTGFGRSPKFQRLLVAPFNLHQGIRGDSSPGEAANAVPQRKARAHPLQDERSGGQGHHRRALRGFPGRRADRPDRPRRLLPGSRGQGALFIARTSTCAVTWWSRYLEHAARCTSF